MKKGSETPASSRFLNQARDIAQSGDRSRFMTAFSETERAYRDYHTDDFEAAMKVRNLDFRCSVEVGKQSAKRYLAYLVGLRGA